MTRATPLPPSLAGSPFLVSDALAAGVSASRLRAHDLDRPTRGVRATRTETVPPPANETASMRMDRLRTELLEHARRIAPALSRDQFFSHETGLALLGVPLPFTRSDSRDVHVSARRPANMPRRHGVVGHRLQERSAALFRVQGLPIEHPARMWRQAAPYWHLDDLIAAGDHLIHPKRGLLTFEDLEREAAEAGEVAGRKLSRALDEIRAGAETAEETKLRLILTRAGLPTPELNWELRRADGSFVARIDIAFPRYRVATEHDGRTHAENDAQFARDSDRWDEIHHEGWSLVRVLSHHMRPDPQIAVDRVARALIAAGWVPGRD